MCNILSGSTIPASACLITNVIAHNILKGILFDSWQVTVAYVFHGLSFDSKFKTHCEIKCSKIEFEN